MMNFTADPRNPLGHRTGSLVGSGTHDEDTVIEGGAAHDAADMADPNDAISGVAQESGAGATELMAWISAREMQR